MSHQELNDRDKKVIAQLLRAYYEKAILQLPEDMVLREFAIQPLGSKTYMRHLSFNSPGELKRFILNHPPLHLYYSSARYEYPDAPNMEDKKWLGADLIFDIDADHIPGCEGSYIYLDENEKKIVEKPVEKEGVTKIVWVTEECIRKAGVEAFKLVRTLHEDFGVKEVSIRFSGHRGFHVHARHRELEKLGSDARREIVDYLQGRGISPETILGAELRRLGNMLVPSLSEGGWRRRIAEYLLEKGVKSGETWRVASKKLRTEMEELVEEAIAYASIDLDENVTIDVKRLVRIPGSLNGKTGFTVLPVDPLKASTFKLDSSEISPYKGEIVIKPRYSMNGIKALNLELEIEKGVNTIIDAPTGIMLVLKGLAEFVKVSGVEVCPPRF